MRGELTYMVLGHRAGCGQAWTLGWARIGSWVVVLRAAKASQVRPSRRPSVPIHPRNRYRRPATDFLHRATRCLRSWVACHRRTRRPSSTTSSEDRGEDHGSALARRPVGNPKPDQSHRRKVTLDRDGVDVTLGFGSACHGGDLAFVRWSSAAVSASSRSWQPSRSGWRERVASRREPRAEPSPFRPSR